MAELTQDILLEWENFSNIIKQLKADIIYITDTKVYGLKCAESILVTTNVEYVPSTLKNTIFILKDFIAIIKDAKTLDNNIVGEHRVGAVYFNTKDHEFRLDDARFNKTINIFDRYISLYNSLNQYSKEEFMDFSDTEEYKDYYALKSKDGSMKLNICNQTAIIFPGILATNKKDKVNMTYYDLNDRMFVLKFDVIKTKKVLVEVLICYIKL